MKLHKYSSTVLNAEDKFSQNRYETSVSAEFSQSASRLNLSQLGWLAIRRLNDKNLEVSKVRPFFWSLVEAYVDRFGLYPFDMNKALFSQLEAKDYPEETVQKLVSQLEARFEDTHGRALRQPPSLPPQVSAPSSLDDEIKALRDSLKYAALLGETDK